MQRQQYLQDLWEQISELKNLYGQLGPRLVQEGNRMQDPGGAPDLALLEEVSAAAGKYKELVNGLEQMAKGLNLSREDWKTDSMVELEALWYELQVRLEKVLLVEQQTREAIAVVERAMEAELPEGESPGELEAFREILSSYREILFRGTMDEEADTLRREIIEKNHPLVALLRLAEGEEMALPDAVELFWKVEGEFGRLFAVASARKSILFPTKMESDGPEEREAQEAVEADENRLASAEFHEPAGLKAEEARELDRKIPALICSLIREEKVGPAYWLACYAEQEGLESPLPSWLIKALELACLVQEENSPSARWLVQLFDEQDFLALAEENSSSRRLPHALLVFAASLRPGIILPACKAGFVLENLTALPPALAQLCRQVADSFPERGIFGADYAVSLEEGPFPLDETYHPGADESGGLQEREMFLGLLQKANAELENLEGELSRDDYFTGAGVAAARKALESLERFLQEQEDGPLAAPEQQQEAGKQLFHHHTEQLQKPSAATIDRLGKEILKYFARREEWPKASADAQLEQETMPRLW